MTIRAGSSAVAGSPHELEEALRPIASLIDKSAKAQRKLAPGTWPHAMLRDNLKALRLAAALMDRKAGTADAIVQAELPEAGRALGSMICRTEKALALFSPGTSQHSLQRNRLKALRMAAAFVKMATAKRRTPAPHPKRDVRNPGKTVYPCQGQAVRARGGGRGIKTKGKRK